jgi:hypothetical protein
MARRAKKAVTEIGKGVIPDAIFAETERRRAEVTAKIEEAFPYQKQDGDGVEYGFAVTMTSVKPANQVHDYSGPNRVAGHDYRTEPISPTHLQVFGSGPEVAAGDTLILEDSYSPTGASRYRVEEVMPSHSGGHAEWVAVCQKEGKE